LSARRFAPLRKEPAYRRVATEIAARVTARELVPGDSLPTELELSEQFSVTRSTVREALRELESADLIARGRGTKRMVVARPSAAGAAARVSQSLALQEVSVGEVWAALTVLCPASAALAAQQRTPADLAALADAAQAFQAAGNTDESLAAVAAFFEALETATGNRALVAAQRPLLPLLQHALQLIIDRVPQARDRIALAQRRLNDAIQRRDRTAAQDWMAKHIRDFRRGFEIAGIDLATRVELTPGAS
jgi:GntR family transcriptional regulator, transcriptional repressor for pyruvate dehydrogenase complex